MEGAHNRYTPPFAYLSPNDSFDNHLCEYCFPRLSQLKYLCAPR